MSYNINLQNKNSLIQELINKANSLPDREEDVEQATPVITIDDTNGLITATAGDKTTTQQMAFQPAKTITPNTVSQIAVSKGYYTGGNVTVAGDSNLVAGNIKSGVSIFGVSGTLEEGSGSSEVVEYSENEDAIINGSISGTYRNDRITEVRSGAFAFCISLVTINLPECTSIEYFSRPGARDVPGAFENCENLTTANFPVCVNIGDCAFYECENLTTISFPVCTNIGKSAFYYCENLTTISFPVCTNIGNSAFYNCKSLTSANFPACTNINESAFNYCYRLTSVNFPACTDIRRNVFDNCHYLISVSFPVCRTIAGSAFRHCYKLTTVSLPTCTIIGSYAFIYCSCLSSLILGASTVCTLSNSNAFTSTPYAGYSSYFSGTPWIYVPASLIDAYKSATNWVYFSSYFSTIESLNNLITFTIEGTEYQAEEDMTWGEWVESEYNTDGCYIETVGGVYDYLNLSSGETIKHSEGSITYVAEASDIIIPNVNYTINEGVLEK